MLPVADPDPAPAKPPASPLGERWADEYRRRKDNPTRNPQPRS